ncbi:uncharacterized protein L3040_004631 [Drepanopeziza brunnea f. sp. 'multigermtubi']|uniref:uncharacterized protein n=1 Tax=Drepanopeziza brunnea f. sp. 'multigermtubi' TaxID=698441 RepID=UPI0023A5F9F1|nr:hypothetical protein L3040_004631 [Drepanopeziza brunnea f. sp. 'multigermtubi']
MADDRRSQDRFTSRAIAPVAPVAAASAIPAVPATVPLASMAIATIALVAIAADTTVSKAAPAATTHSSAQHPDGKPARTPLPSGRTSAAPTTTATLVSLNYIAFPPSIDNNHPLVPPLDSPSFLPPHPPQPGAPIPDANFTATRYACPFQGYTKDFDKDRTYKRHYGDVDHLGNRWYCQQY